ncbi:MAG TPA: site-2 protease family protein, partial [Flavisolibacter sp.]|nr:site-2 protease family protein [Flavisolibacter sp.]
MFANIGQFILAFSILVVLHELGHMLPAKWFGCRVDKFYLFFNPWFSLWKTKKGETEYGLGWIPLGGYVKIAGMIDESMDKEQMKLPAQPYEFRAKPAWQRLIIMLGGVTVNFILALVLFAMILFVWGNERLPVANMKYGLVTDSLAMKAGLRDGDKITAVNGKPVQYFEDIAKGVVFNETVKLSLNRNGVDTTLTLPSGFLSALTKRQAAAFVFPRVPAVVKDDPEANYVSGELKEGDQIVGVNGKSVFFFDEFSRAKKDLKNQNISVQVLRN